MTDKEAATFRTIIHWSLISKRRHIMDADPKEDDHVTNQAMFCPAYVTVSGAFASDWGVILCPSSEKFGQLVFEHEWCGHTFHPHDEKVWKRVLS